MPNYIRSKPTFWIYLLLCLMAFQACGWLMLLQGVQWSLKNQSKQIVFEKTTPIETRAIPIQLFESNRMGRHEILLEGQLFDIKSISRFPDSVRLELYHDHKEEKFARHWQSLWSCSQQSNSDANHPNFLLAKWLGTAFVECPLDDLDTIPTPFFFTYPHKGPEHGTQSAPSVLSPPPRQT